MARAERIDPTPGREIETAESSRSPQLSVRRVLPAYQQVADQLRNQILQGELKTGDRLPNESQLCEWFGVSRSTVREALRALASRGLVRTERGTTGGSFVARIDRGQVSEYLEASLGLMTGSRDVTVAEMLEAREILEVPAARLAAARASEAHIIAMREALEREMSARGGRGQRFEEHRAFHLILAEAAGNSLLWMMDEPVFQVLRSRFLRQGTSDDIWADVDADHASIIACIEAGDEDGAAEAMRIHLRRLRELYLD